VGVVPAAPDLKPVTNPDELDEYRLEWQSTAGASGYILEEADNPQFSGEGLRVRYQGAALSYAVTGQRGGEWYYRVRASNQAGNGPWSGTVQTVVKPSAAPAPEFTKRLVANKYREGQYLLSWTTVAEATAYMLEGSRDAYFSSPEKVYEGDDTQFSVTGRGDGLWYYRVRAVTPSGKSPWSESVLVQIQVYMPQIRR
jgi:hypothetical protein